MWKTALLRSLARVVISAPPTRPTQTASHRNEQEVTVSYKKDIENTKEPQQEQGVANINLLDEIEPTTQKHELSIENIDTTPTLALSRLGESVQSALSEFGVLKKYNIGANIFLEDLKKTTEFNIFYFTYDKDLVSPADFIREIEKDSGRVSLNLNAVIICNAVQLKFVSNGIGCVIIDGGM